METGLALFVMMVCLPRPIHLYENPNYLEIDRAQNEMVDKIKPDALNLVSRFETLTWNVRNLVEKKLIKPMSWDELPWKHGLSFMYYCIPEDRRFRTRITTLPSIKHWESSLDYINAHKSQIAHESDDFIAKIHRKLDKEVGRLPNYDHSQSEETISSHPNRFDRCLDIFNVASVTKLNLPTPISNIDQNTDPFTDNTNIQSSTPTSPSNEDHMRNHNFGSTTTFHDQSMNHHGRFSKSRDTGYSSDHHIPPITLTYPDQQSTDHHMTSSFSRPSPSPHRSYFSDGRSHSPMMPYTGYETVPTAYRSTRPDTSHGTLGYRSQEQQPALTDYGGSYLYSRLFKTEDASQLEKQDSDVHSSDLTDVMSTRRSRGRKI